MALFKPYYGTKEELDKVASINDGYVYFTTDDGHMYADVGGERLQVCSSATIEATLIADGWVLPEGAEYYSQTIDWPELTCGPAGTTPPICTWSSNQDEYSLIDHAEAEAGVGVTFYIDTKPSEDINIIITDVK